MLTTLLENPLPIAAVGGLAAAFAAIVFFSRRNLASLVALAAVIVVTLLLLAVERFVLTDREQVESSLRTLLASVEANDLTNVLASIDPAAAEVRRDAEALMPLIKVEKARATGAVEVTVNDSAAPPTATASFRGFLSGVHPRSGSRVGYFNQRIDVQWIRRGDRWLLDGYTAYYDDRPIDAVGSARGNRPVP